MEVKTTTKTVRTYSLEDLEALFRQQLDIYDGTISITTKTRSEEYMISNTESDSIEYFDGLIVTSNS